MSLKDCTIARTGRWALRAADIALVAVLVAIWLPCLPDRAFAYVDPSVMTYTIQALAGVAVALSAVAGVVFRRVRRRLFKIFKIDETANKAREGEIARISPDAADAAAQFAAADERAAKLREQSIGSAWDRGLDALNVKKRFAFALLMCVFVFFIVLVAPAIEIFGANTDSLVFGVGKVWWISAAINAAFAVLCAIALSALKGKKFLAALLLVFCVGFAAYIQAFFLNKGMMPADGGFIGWTDWYFVEKMIISGIVWLVILIVPQILSRRHRLTWLKATSALAVAIIIMQGVGVASVAIDASNNSLDDKAQPYVTQGGLYTVSPTDNVVVFVLDTYDTRLLEEMRAEDPHTLDPFTGFTYWPDSVGTMVPTMNAIPNLLTGLKPEVGQDVAEYRATRYERGIYLPTIAAAGYSMGIFTDTAMLNYANESDAAIARNTINIHPLGRAPVDIWNTYVVMNQCALYRQAPWVAKPAFWYYTTDINNRMIGTSDSPDGNDAVYELDDAQILQTLRERGLSATDTNGVGAYRFIHLFGPHFPFNVDENGNDIGVGRSDQKRQAIGSLKVVEQYIAELKRLGLYDQATIIITADHGIWGLSEDPIQQPTSPFMLAKPSTAPGGSDAPCQISPMPVSHDDVDPTVIAAIGGDPTTLCSGMTLFQVNDPNRIRYYDATTNVGSEGQRFVEYKIEGNVLDLNNWSKTGNVWYGA